MKTLIRIIQWIFGISFFINGFSMIMQGYLIGLFVSILGLLTIPLFFDWLNISFAKKQFNRRAFKAGILIMGIISIVSISEMIIEDEFHNIHLSIENLTNQIATQGIENVDRAFIYSVHSILNDHKEHLPDSLKSFSKDLEELMKILSPEINTFAELDYGNFVPNMVQMDKFQKGEFIHFLQDSLLNEEYNKILSTNIPTKKDFQSTYDYYIYRAKHASQNGYPVETVLYLDSILTKTRNVDIDSNLIIVALSYSKIDDKQFYRIRKYAEREFKNNVSINKVIAIKYRNENNLSSSYNYYSRILKKKPNDSDILTELALLANERKRKKSAIKHLEKLNELGQLNEETCNLLRELTRYFSHWTYYSNCCDGSVSSSTGRGACSHHGGVCSTGKRANYRYKYNRCRF